MKYLSAAKKLQKAGFNHIGNYCRYETFKQEGNKYVVEIDNNQGETRRIAVRRFDDFMDTQSDYFPWNYFDSLSRAIAFAGRISQ